MEELNGEGAMATHIRETKEALCDIEGDLHRMMKEDDKVSEGFDTGALMGMLANKGMESAKTEVNKEIFETMEQAVADTEAVAEAKKHLADVKSQIIYEYCMRDPRYVDAMSAYRDTVNAEYVRSREKKVPAKGARDAS